MPGQQPRLRATADGRPVVVLSPPVEGVLRYRTAPVPDPDPPAPTAAPSGLPPRLLRRARELRPLPVARRVAVLQDLVRRRVVYDDSTRTARRHRESIARGDGFIQRVLAIGAGDCDVQNGLLTALLHAAGVPARLAVGYLGDRGTVLPWVHAWVEYADAAGRWMVADASDGVRTAGPAGAELVAATRPARGSPPRTADRSAPLDWSDPAEAFAVADAASAAAAARAAVPPAASAPPTTAAGRATVPAAASAPPTTAARPVAPAAPAAGPAAPAAGPAAPAARPAVPAARPIDAPDGPGTWGLRMGLPVLLLLGGAWLFASRTRSAFKLDSAADLSRLLKGVLQQPAAFAHIRALFYRPLVPCADGKAVSLIKARDLAQRGRLFFTRAATDLARSGMRAGAVVLDYGAEEGRTVADALGAVDLDSWARLIERASDDPLLEGVNRLLRSHGEAWAVRASVRVDSGVAAIDLASLGTRVPGVHGTRLVVVDQASDWLAEARRFHESRPQAAIFMVLDQLALRLHLPRPRRTQLLGESARQAILESFAV
jgi:hypothetical protein